VIGVGGCVASQEGEGIQKRAPFVDIVFGPQTLHRLPKMLDDSPDVSTLAKKITLVDVSFPEIEKFDFLPEPRVEGHKPLFPSWKAAPNTAPSAWCPTPAVKKCLVRFDDVIAEIASARPRACAK
jgi:tRNA-2-methylthio-N6-dimethylallyladenosine synthase